jgi:plastocyanin
MRLRLMVLVSCAATLAVGCAKPAPTPAPPPSAPITSKPSGTDPATTAAADKTAPEAEQPAESSAALAGPTGRIEGVVAFTGDEIPTATLVDNGTDPQICGAQVSKRDVVIHPDSRGIQFVLVTLVDVKLPDGYKPTAQKLVLDNKNCQFEPHAAVLTVGSTIETTNSDNVYHTTNLSGAATENIPLVSKGAVHTTKVRRPGLIGVKCDKHGWMQAYIRVDAHPFHAVTDADGKFAIAGVPVGTYKMKAWHERFYDQEVEVTVKENESTSVELKYPTPDTEK